MFIGTKIKKFFSIEMIETNEKKRAQKKRKEIN
jgi:hypothetical protein